MLKFFGGRKGIFSEELVCIDSYISLILLLSIRDHDALRLVCSLLIEQTKTNYKD